jgi:hypothetical protein
MRCEKGDSVNEEIIRDHIGSGPLHDPRDRVVPLRSLDKLVLNCEITLLY